MADDRVSLTTAIDSLRREIMAAAQKAQALDPNVPRFRITKVQLELTVAAEDSVTTGAEVGWWVLKARADVTGKDIVTHKVNVELNVGDIAVGDENTTP